MFQKKNPPDELAQHVSKNNSPRTNFSFQSSESHTVFSIIYTIQIRIFGPARFGAVLQKKQVRDLVAMAAANGQCSPHAVGRWRTLLERVLLTAQADTYLRALGSRVSERPAAEPPLLLAE